MFVEAMTNIQFQLNLSLVLAHTVLLEVKGVEPIGEAWAVNTSPLDPFNLMAKDVKIPPFVPVNIQKEQARATTSNVANFGAISKLAGTTNAFNQEQLNAMLESAAPGYKNIVSKMGERTGEFLSGEIPKDVQDQIGRNAAYKSLSGGFSGSGMARNLVARDLGLTSLDLIGKGIDAGTRWAATARAGTAEQFNPASMFLSTDKALEVRAGNLVGSFQRALVNSQNETKKGFWGHTAQGGEDLSKL